MLPKNSSHEYSWKGVYKYSNKTLRLCDKDSWLIKVKGRSGVKIQILAKYYVENWDSLIGRLNQNSLKYSDFFKWLSNNQGSCVAYKSPNIFCLNNFLGSKLKKATYTIISSIVNKNMTVKIKYEYKGINKYNWLFMSFDKSIWKVIIDEYLIALWPFFLTMGKTGKNGRTEKKRFKIRSNINKDIIEFLRSYRLRQVFEVKKDKNKIIFDAQASMTPYHKGLICECLPIPGKSVNRKGDEPYTIRSPEIVVTSPNVVEALAGC